MLTNYPVVLLKSLLFPSSILFFFFNDTATTEIYTLSLHDALPISQIELAKADFVKKLSSTLARCESAAGVCFRDRKSTRLNSSHQIISYAVFCLKKKKETINRLFDVESMPTPSHSM